jgi:hypothetical protein
MNIEKSALKAHALVSPGPSPDIAGARTDEEDRMRRRRRVENLISICWGLIALKSLLVVWAVGHYSIPFNPMWVVGPTVAFALVATVAYYRMRK